MPDRILPRDGRRRGDERPPARPASRATAPVVAVTAMLAVTVVLAAVVGGLVFANVPDEGRPPVVSLSLSVRGDRIVLTHRGGDALDVREVRLRVSVDGTPLARQPPVPFFSAVGFRSGPTGPFNVAADPRWTAGEAASLRVAGTNRPTIGPGATVEVTVSAGGRPVADLSATARPGG
ncbi:MAG: type IV pilin [Salinigranum sp.]